MPIILRVFGKAKKLYEYFVMLILSAMITSVFANVFSRYVLNRSLGWVDELARFLFIWLVFLAAVLAYEKSEHIGLDFVVQYIPEKFRGFVILISEILVLGALVILSYYGYRVALGARNISPGLGLRMTYVYFVVPVSAVLMTGISVRRVIVQAKEAFTPSTPGDGKQVRA